MQSRDLHRLEIFQHRGHTSDVIRPCNSNRRYQRHNAMMEKILINNLFDSMFFLLTDLCTLSTCLYHVTNTMTVQAEGQKVRCTMNNRFRPPPTKLEIQRNFANMKSVYPSSQHTFSTELTRLYIYFLDPRIFIKNK